MDALQIIDKAKDTLLFLPLAAAGAAGLSTVALLFGVARLNRNGLPEGFPSDPEAAQRKYWLAFTQLGQERDDALAERRSRPATDAASLLARQAFTTAQTVQVNPGSKRRE